jgi:hypothetical protein
MSRRIIKNNKSTLPSIVSNSENPADDVEAELRFDNEVLWCCTQFEKLIESGKLNDSKSKILFKVKISILFIVS